MSIYGAEICLNMAGKAVDNHKEAVRLYEEDTRSPCKYGIECYQKNTAHLEKYKHPPKGDVPDQTWDQEDEESPPRKIKKVLKPNIRKSSQQSSEKLVGQNRDQQPSGETDVLSLPDVKRDAIKLAFLVEMPDDFYNFWLFCQSLKEKDPAGALADGGLSLVGPFDVLANKFKDKKYKKTDFLRHWRYYYDPPEFQTVIKGDDKEQFHMGYYRDEPAHLPCFVASNCASKSCELTPVGENLFGAVNSFLETLKNKADPFRKVKINALMKALQSWASKNSFTLDSCTPAMKKRLGKVNAKTFHKAGIVVPVNKKTDTGYRPLLETEANLKRLLKNIVEADTESQRLALMSKLQPILTAADIANDEGDVGNSLELGLDLFTFGGEVFHRRVEHLLCTAYSLLNREEFSEILKSHLQDRRKGTNLSIIDEK